MIWKIREANPFVRESCKMVKKSPPPPIPPPNL